MAEERRSDDHLVTKQDFEDCGWKIAISQTVRDGYPSISRAFADAAGQAIEEGRRSHGKVLFLLANACSMKLSSNSFNEPFKPFFAMQGRRSAIPNDFFETDIAFFIQILDEIDDPWLKARLADLVWLMQQPRDVRFALTAIDSYRSIKLDTETWISGGKECWERALLLTRLVKNSAGERLKELEALVLKAFHSATRENGFLAVWLSDLLIVNRFGKGELSTIAQKLESLAHEIENEDDFHRARAFFFAAAKWFSAVGDKAKSIEMTVNVAESWVKEAAVRLASDQPSQLVAAGFYESAIQTYRSIPRSERARHGVDKRISELHTQLNDASEKSLAELSRMNAPVVDLIQFTENARNAVRGKSLVEALKGFANLIHGVKVKELRQNALMGLREFPLRNLFPGTILSRDGRVIARYPGMSLNGSTPEDDELVIRIEMIRNFGTWVDLVVQGSILPALEILLIDHRLREIDFLEVTSHSPIVPHGREGLFAKALFAGFDGDYVTALHLLVPQIEHMVRHHLKQVGVKTTTLTSDGIESENGLSTLMDSPQVTTVFGEDLAFEIRALFCDTSGPNLRNELAHGLADEEVCYSTSSIYAWWFGLRLIFITFWNAAEKVGVDSMTDDSVEK